MDPAQVERMIQSFPYLSQISAEDWQQAQLTFIEPGITHSVQSGHAMEHAVFVISGCIRIYKMSDTGREITLYRVQNGEGCMLMMASILGETEYGASAVVETRSEILLVAADTFKQWTPRYPLISQYVYKQFIKRMFAVTELLDHVAFKPIDYRIADFLLRNSSDHTKVLVVTHEQMAIELGTAREVISRVLKTFEHTGIVRLHRGKITHIDRSSLEQIKQQFV
jgi:CRP/FNR family transcriptional regulator